MEKIVGYNHVGLCAEQRCSKKSTHFEIITLNGISLHITFCQRHADMYDRHADMFYTFGNGYTLKKEKLGKK